MTNTANRPTSYLRPAWRREDHTTVLICGECGEGNYRPITAPTAVKCDHCDHVMRGSDFVLDAGEDLALVGGLLAVVHGTEQ